VTLKPGGFHIMFMDLAGPMVAGETVDVTLTFEKAGDVMVTMPIVMRPAGGMSHGTQEDKS
jgi:copper(I)-binding protein